MEYMIAGLGNPGEKYDGTRHNAGRSALCAFANAHNFPEWEFRKDYDALSTRAVLENVSVHLLLPETFMNNSGKAVKKALQDAGEGAEVVIVYDDIDMPLGALKISYDRGSGGHHGIDSVIAELKTRAFTRLRIGIAPVFDGVLRKPQGEEAVMSFLMKPFTPGEQESWNEVLKKMDGGLMTLLARGRAEAMNAVN